MNERTCDTVDACTHKCLLLECAGVLSPSPAAAAAIISPSEFHTRLVRLVLLPFSCSLFSVSAAPKI